MRASVDKPRHGVAAMVFRFSRAALPDCGSAGATGSGGKRHLRVCVSPDNRDRRPGRTLCLVSGLSAVFLTGSATLQAGKRVLPHAPLPRFRAELTQPNDV